MRARLLVVGAMAAVAVPLLAQPAVAGDGAAWTQPDEEEGAIDFGATDGTRTGGGPPSSQCTWTLVDPEEWPDGDGALPVTERGGNQAYDWYIKECVAPDGTVSSELIAVLREQPPVDPTALRDEVIDRLGLPTPAVAMNPPGDQVVHVATWLWIDDGIWRVHSKSASAGGVTVTVTAAPQRVVWEMGNGDVVVCEGPGTPYDPSVPEAEQRTECSYTYRSTSAGQPGEAFEATVSVHWDVSWSVTGAPGGGVLPELVTSMAMSVRVGEMQALNQ